MNMFFLCLFSTPKCVCSYKNGPEQPLLEDNECVRWKNKNKKEFYSPNSSDLPIRIYLVGHFFLHRPAPEYINSLQIYVLALARNR